MYEMVQIDDKYNLLTVRKRLPNHVTKGGSCFTKWLCECDCGNFVEVLGASLTSGHTKSCGCLSKKPKVPDESMLHKKFGMLTVIGRAPSHKLPSGSVNDMWYCKCDCGNHTTTFGRHLRANKITSCGCIRAKRQAEAGREPKAEKWTREYLDEKQISYEYQKSFPDLIGVNDGLLSYDFWLSDKNILLELNGLQHYKPVDWFGGDEGFQKQQIHDKRKVDFAVKNRLRLIAIPTDHISKKSLIEQLQSFDI